MQGVKRGVGAGEGPEKGGGGGFLKDACRSRKWKNNNLVSPPSIRNFVFFKEGKSTDESDMKGDNMEEFDSGKINYRKCYELTVTPKLFSTSVRFAYRIFFCEHPNVLI